MTKATKGDLIVVHTISRPTSLTLGGAYAAYETFRPAIAAAVSREGIVTKYLAGGKPIAVPRDARVLVVGGSSALKGKAPLEVRARLKLHYSTVEEVRAALREAVGMPAQNPQRWAHLPSGGVVASGQRVKLKDGRAGTVRGVELATGRVIVDVGGEVIARALVDLRRVGIGRLEENAPRKNPGRGRVMSRRVLALEYVHAQTNKHRRYRHDFEAKGVELIALEDGSLSIRHPKHKLHAQFTVKADE